MKLSMMIMYPLKIYIKKRFQRSACVRKEHYFFLKYESPNKLPRTCRDYLCELGDEFFFCYVLNNRRKLRVNLDFSGIFKACFSFLLNPGRVRCGADILSSPPVASIYFSRVEDLGSKRMVSPYIPRYCHSNMTSVFPLFFIPIRILDELYLQVHPIMLCGHAVSASSSSIIFRRSS